MISSCFGILVEISRDYLGDVVEVEGAASLWFRSGTYSIGRSTSAHFQSPQTRILNRNLLSTSPLGIHWKFFADTHILFLGISSNSSGLRGSLSFTRRIARRLHHICHAHPRCCQQGLNWLNILNLVELVNCPFQTEISDKKSTCPPPKSPSSPR